MKIGIVGSEEAKFTHQGRQDARNLIRQILMMPGVTEVVSGACHLGGIDIWAAEIGHELGLIVTEYAPEILQWSSKDGKIGYEGRNLKIADTSDVVHCITVSTLPEEYTGMRFKLCYHCKTDSHVKSGGCWTMIQARKRGKEGVLHVIKNF